MDMDLSPSQELLRENARTFFERSWSMGDAREQERSERGYSREQWIEMADLGFLGITLPEQHDGIEGSFTDQAVLCEEFGRWALPGPYLTTVVDSASLILASGTDEQKQQFLPGIAGGTLIVALALAEVDLDWDPTKLQLEATRRGDELELHGTKLFVPYAGGADYVLCLARSSDGLVAAMVPVSAAGLSVRLMPATPGVVYYEAIFDRVKVAWEDVLGGGTVDETVVDGVLARGAIAQAVYAIGMNRRILEMAADYAKVRVQFDKPIGSYQGIQHRLAEMLSYLDAAQCLAYQAAWRLSEGLPAEREVAIAKAYTNQVTWKVILDGHDVFGGVGYMVDHDLDLYTRRGMATLLHYGTTEFHRSRVADHMGLQAR
jgi:alkylation response protein AidB-like acyl-CoA dehydrogenase